MSIPLLGARTDLTRRRFGATTYDGNGEPTQSSTDTTFTGSVQPASSRDIERLPEGERSKAVVKVYAVSTTLRTVEQADQTLADRVVVSSGPLAGTYEVSQVQDYPTGPLPHCRAICTRLREAA